MSRIIVSDQKWVLNDAKPPGRSQKMNQKTPNFRSLYKQKREWRRESVSERETQEDRENSDYLLSTLRSRRSIRWHNFSLDTPKTHGDRGGRHRTYAETMKGGGRSDDKMLSVMNGRVRRGWGMTKFEKTADKTRDVPKQALGYWNRFSKKDAENRKTCFEPFQKRTVTENEGNINFLNSTGRQHDGQKMPITTNWQMKKCSELSTRFSTYSEEPCDNPWLGTCWEVGQLQGKEIWRRWAVAHRPLWNFGRMEWGNRWPLGSALG